MCVWFCYPACESNSVSKEASSNLAKRFWTTGSSVDAVSMDVAVSALENLGSGVTFSDTSSHTTCTPSKISWWNPSWTHPTKSYHFRVNMRWFLVWPARIPYSEMGQIVLARSFVTASFLRFPNAFAAGISVVTLAFWMHLALRAAAAFNAAATA